MYIDTTSKEKMEQDVSTYLGITVDELYQYIDYAAEKAQEGQWAFNCDIFNSELETIFVDLQPENTLDEMLVFHLARRLPDSLDSYDGDNLYHLLTTENPLSAFLTTHEVQFHPRGTHLELFYKGENIPLDDTMNHNVCYLRSRLGFNRGREDYCFNGFALRDLLMKNSYTRELYYGPEFLTVLARFLNDNMIRQDFFEKSNYHCYTYLLPFDMVIFDNCDKLTNSEKKTYLLLQVCARLLAYQTSQRGNIYDHENPVVRFADNSLVPEKYIRAKEKITLDMIE